MSTRLEGAVNVDLNQDTRPDIVWDLNRFPFPFEPDSFDMVVAISVLEHLDDFMGVMAEIHRVSRHGASVYILVPHFSSGAAFVDPTHKQHLSARSCDYFIQGTLIEKEFGFYAPFRYQLIRRYIELQGILNFFPPLRWFVQRYCSLWENHFCYIIRGSGIFWELAVVKESKPPSRHQ